MDFKPTKIGKYLLLDRLATGGMAEVYLARATGAGGFEKQVAIKRILPHYSRNEEFRRMFEYEARLSSSLNHANIVQIFDFVKSGETYLLAMEFVDGKNLRQFVNKVKKMGYSVPVEFGVYVINEVCKGLEYAHNKKETMTGRPLNIIHRDMSPQNVMISYEGAVKIVDFGIAKAKDRVDETRSGVIKGKFGYMSPEQANGIAVDHRTDIFSSAIILWELLTSRRLFSADNDLATLKLIQECVIAKPTKANPKIPLELEKILLRGLTKEPGNRFQDAGTFHRQLQEFLNKSYSSFTQREVAEVLHRVFATEIEAEKRKFENLHRQSIPFSQGGGRNEENNFDDIEAAIEGSVTRSEQASQSAITFIDEEDAAKPLSFELDESVKQETAVSTGAETQGSHSRPSQHSSHEETKVEPGFLDDDLPPVSLSQSSQEEDSAPSTEAEAEASLKELSRNDSVSSPYKSLTVPEKIQHESNITSATESHTSETVDTPIEKTDSGLISLQGPKTEQNPQRLGSYSLINQLSQDPHSDTRTSADGKTESSPDDDGDESAPSILVDAPRRSPSFQAPHQREREYEPEQPKEKPPSFVPLFFVFLLIGVTFYAYRFLLSGKMGGFISTPREVATPPRPLSSLPSPEANGGALPDSCSLTIESDPPGATAIVDKLAVGQVPRTLITKCKASVNITLKLSDHDEVTSNVFISQHDNLFRKKLNRIPKGIVEFLINSNAAVFVDGQSVGTALANRPFPISVRANMKHEFRFVNEVFGSENTLELSVKDGIRTTQVVKLIDRVKKR